MSKSAQSQYNAWMNSIQESLTISMSPSDEAAKLVRAEYKALTGSDNAYDNKELFDSLYAKACTRIEHKGITLLQAQALAEPMRIANPDQCVSIYAGNSFIGNTTWNTQMDLFWEYKTYTPEGDRIAAERKAAMDAIGRVAAWE